MTIRRAAKIVFAWTMNLLSNLIAAIVTLSIVFTLGFLAVEIGRTLYRLAILLFLVATGASCASHAISFDDYRQRPWIPCFDSESGLRVYRVEPAACPEPREVDRVVAQALYRTSSRLEHVFGTRVVYVPEPIRSHRGHGREATGMASVSEIGADVLVSDWALSSATLRHELGHVMRFRRKGDGDAGHVDCAWWWRLESRRRSRHCR